MLGAPLVAGTEVPFSSVMGKQRRRRIESTYPIYVTSTEQDKPVSLPKGKDQPQGGLIAARV